ncbi:MAG TPA: hypothetical protein VNF24_06530 [Candidatus Acidoferrales bacterium]|nr:hypothetical protein [Candidatus Acidoferrales bacterium]
MNRDYIKREWGAVAFVVTAILGGLAVLVALIVKAASPTAIPPTPPCPRTTPVVIQAPASPAASATPTISIKPVPFGCPTAQVTIGVRSPSPTASATPPATAKATPTATATAKPSASPTG